MMILVFSANSIMNGGTCLYQDEKGYFPEPEKHPAKFYVQFNTWYIKTGWSNTFYVVDTDYTGYAVIYACREVFSNGKCNPSKAFVLTLNRVKEGHTQMELDKIDAVIPQLCVNKALQMIQHTGKCGFIPGAFPKSSATISDPFSGLQMVETLIRKANPIVNSITNSLGLNSLTNVGRARMAMGGGTGMGMGMGMGGPLAGMMGGGPLGGLFGGRRGGMMGAEAEMDPMMMMMMQQMQQEQMQQQNTAAAAANPSVPGTATPLGGGITQALMSNPFVQTLNQLAQNMGPTAFDQIMQQAQGTAVNTALRRAQRTG